nr:MAG TPA: ChiA1-BD-binding domain protein [Caudoviricetes sp.]
MAKDIAFLAAQMNRAIQMFTQNLNLPDEQAMEVADLYPEWQEKKAYAVDEILKYGENADGETQLYKVLQAHTSQADWTPDTAASLYKKVGFTDGGVPMWTQPLGATDAYKKGDVVSYNGQLYVSTVDANVWEPGIYGWELKN